MGSPLKHCETSGLKMSTITLTDSDELDNANVLMFGVVDHIRKPPIWIPK